MLSRLAQTTAGNHISISCGLVWMFYILSVYQCTTNNINAMKKAHVHKQKRKDVIGIQFGLNTGSKLWIVSIRWNKILIRRWYHLPPPLLSLFQIYTVPIAQMQTKLSVALLHSNMNFQYYGSYLHTIFFSFSSKMQLNHSGTEPMILRYIISTKCLLSSV